MVLKLYDIEQDFFDPIIYAYTEPQYKNVEWKGGRSGSGLIKVGFTKSGLAEERIREQFPTNKPVDDPYEILIEEFAYTDDGRYFDDKEVHRMLESYGVSRCCPGGKRSEWFECTEEEVRKAIEAVVNGKNSMKNIRFLDFKPRPEQKNAVEITSEYFKKYKRQNTERVPHFLWNAKMRFGKTFTTYQLAKNMGWKKLLILTFKPVVKDSWRNDLLSHKDFEDWKFFSAKDDDFVNILTPFVCFASFQDILGKTKLGGIKAKNQKVVEINWDCIVFDEYHFGAWRHREYEETDLTIDEKEELNEDKAIEKDFDFTNEDEDLMPTKTNHYLYLSGTPFRAFANGEFVEDQIFNWTYADEQKAKNSWAGSKEENPYLDLPKINMFVYNLPEEIRKVALNGEENEFNLNEFFKANDEGFKYKKEVNDWLNIMIGQYGTIAEKNVNVDQAMPFHDIKLRNYLKHTLWYLPNVASCNAMKTLLEQHPFFNSYKVVCCAGTKAGIGEQALKPVKELIGDNIKSRKDKHFTITLTCGKLTTGTTVEAWTGVFILRNIMSPESYFQTAFRVQSPWVIRNACGINPNEKTILKYECFIFDFAPNRALSKVREYSSNLSLQNNNIERKEIDELTIFLKFLPIIAYDGSTMKKIDADELLSFSISGTTGSMLARKWKSNFLVNIDNYVLDKVLKDEKLVNIIQKLQSFRDTNVQAEFEFIVNSNKEINDIKKLNEGILETNPEIKEELTKKEKEYKNKREEIKKKLLKFISRVPIFMYLSEFREYCLKDVINKLEPKLFELSTGINVEEFNKLIGVNLFNESYMNDAIFAFRNYENDSLNYTGIVKDSLNVGLFNTVLDRDDLNRHCLTFIYTFKF